MREEALGSIEKEEIAIEDLNTRVTESQNALTSVCTEKTKKLQETIKSTLLIEVAAALKEVEKSFSYSSPTTSRSVPSKA